MKRERSMDAPSIHFMLEGGDRRSIGRANDVAALVIKQPEQFVRLIEYLQDSDGLVRQLEARGA